MKKELTALVVVCVLVLCAGFYPAKAQSRLAADVQEWPQGKVVMVNGDTLYGALTYYRTPDIVKVRHEDGTISSVTPVNVEYFIAQEMPSGKSLTFRTLNWDMGKVNSGFKKPTFFEELNRGALTLIMRENYSISGNRNYSKAMSYYDPGYYAGESGLDAQVIELYFILLPSGEIVSLRNPRRDLHVLFGEKSKDVKSYIKLNKLAYEKPHELVAIINYFNSLVSSTSRVH